MNDRERSVLEYLRTYVDERGIAPTYREISRGCEIPSTSIVRYYLDKLEKKALIRRYNNVPRGIVLL